jgi:hypothetical protein
VMNIQRCINMLRERQLEQRRAANYVVLSDPCHSALRLEIRGVDFVLENPQTIKERITEYMGMKVIVLDRDDIFVEVG